MFRDRHLQLATEARSMEEMSKAHMGMGRVYVAQGRNRCALPVSPTAVQRGGVETLWVGGK